MLLEMRTRKLQKNGFVPSNHINSNQEMPGLKASTIAEVNDGQLEPPIEHVEEPLLHYIPKSISPIYRAVPWLLDVPLILLSILASAVTTWKRITWLQPLAIFKGWKATPSFRELLAFATKVSALVMLNHLSLSANTFMSA